VQHLVRSNLLTAEDAAAAHLEIVVNVHDHRPAEGRTPLPDIE
jgi:hypothetical protein